MFCGESSAEAKALLRLPVLLWEAAALAPLPPGLCLRARRKRTWPKRRRGWCTATRHLAAGLPEAPRVERK